LSGNKSSKKIIATFDLQTFGSLSRTVHSTKSNTPSAFRRSIFWSRKYVYQNKKSI